MEKIKKNIFKALLVAILVTMYSMVNHGTQVKADDIPQINVSALVSEVTANATVEAQYISNHCIMTLYNNGYLITTAIPGTDGKMQGMENEAFAYPECFYTDVTNIIIADGVTMIGERAFQYVSDYYYRQRCVDKIIVSGTVREIGAYAFEYCQCMQFIIIDGVQIIDDYAFSSAMIHEGKLIIPNTVTSVGDGVFECILVDEAILPNTITRIPSFAYASACLQKVVIPDNITVIGKCAFCCCYCWDYDIPNTITRIEPEAFAGSRIESFEIPPLVTVLEDSILDGATNLTSITIPDRITSIGASALSGTSIESIVIPESVTHIGGCAFDNCRKLRSVTLPSTITSIGFGMFSQCYSLISFAIPDNITHIGSYAFFDCTFAEPLNLNNVTQVDDNAFLDAYFDSIIAPNVTSVESESFRVFDNEPSRPVMVYVSEDSCLNNQSYWANQNREATIITAESAEGSED